MKKTTAEVRLDYMNKDLSFDPGEIGAQPGDLVVVETDYGMDMGLLTEYREDRELDETQLPLKRILRLASEEDVKRQDSLGEREQEAFSVCGEEISKAKLDMKLVSARFSFDGTRVTFCYTAENRVDFRELVKTLASRLQTRIELRQVGVRDEARLFGGYGPCGRRLCCSAFLRDFKSVSIKMAKEQGLPLNPMKISGVCGRLFCCLKYEYDEYLQLRKFLPHYGETIQQGDIKGRIVNINVMKRAVTVATEGGGWAEIIIDVPEEKLKCTCGAGCCKDQGGDSEQRPKERRQKDRKKQGKDNRDKGRNRDGEKTENNADSKDAVNNDMTELNDNAAPVADAATGQVQAETTGQQEQNAPQDAKEDTANDVKEDTAQDSGPKEDNTSPEPENNV